MPPEIGRGILLYFPFGNVALRANPGKPFIAQPARRTAVSGILDCKRSPAVRGDTGGFSLNPDRLNTVEHSPAGRPQLDLVDQGKKVYPFAIKFLFFRYIACIAGEFISKHGSSTSWNQRKSAKTLEQATFPSTFSNDQLFL